jgi:lipopolysaccharide export system protein LptC
MGSRGFAVEGGRDAERLFRRAMRHSRRVRLLRRTIPVLVVLILAATVLVRWLDPMHVLARLPASVEGVVISGTKISMAAPKLSGYTNDSRRYEMTATSAAQDVTKPNLVELNVVRAMIETADKSPFRISAAGGVFDRSSGMLTLSRDVKATGAGFDVLLEEAVINTATSEIVSDKPVQVRAQQTTIRSNRLEVTSGGEVVVFIGAVNVYIPPNEPDAGQKPAGKP